MFILTDQSDGKNAVVRGIFTTATRAREAMAKCANEGYTARRTLNIVTAMENVRLINATPYEVMHQHKEQGDT